MKQLNNNKIQRDTKKWFFLIGGIIVLFILLVITVVFLVKKAGSKTNQNEKKETVSETISFPNLSLEDWKKCPYLNEIELTTFDPKRRYSKLILDEIELSQWRQIPQEFIVKCWKKGYHWKDILELWEWKLPDSAIPDLKAKQRIGIINVLAWTTVPISIIEDKSISKEEKLKMFDEDRFGNARNLVIILKKSASGGQINISKRIAGASSFCNTLKYAKKLITFALNQENIDPSQYEIFMLEAIGVEDFGKEESHLLITGKSFGSAAYLALLSALHQKPIAKSVAATGTINTSQKKSGKVNDQAINLVTGDNLPIVGLNGKSHAAVKKGVKYLVLSAYNNSPNLLGQNHKTDYWDENGKHITEKWSVAEDYLKVVSPEIREKLTVYWTKNIAELKSLLFSGKLD